MNERLDLGRSEEADAVAGNGAGAGLWEKLLLVAALAFAVGFDRLVAANLFMTGSGFLVGFGIFMLAGLVFFAAVYRRRVVKSPYYIAALGLCIAQGVWLLLPFAEREEGFAVLNVLLLPLSCMALSQMVANDYQPKEILSLFTECLMGFFAKPFIGIGKVVRALGSLTARQGPGKRVLIGVLISVPILFVLLPLLISADMALAYYVRGFFERFNLSAVINHGIIIIVAFFLIYSFMWETGMSKRTLTSVSEAKAGHPDTLVVAVVLSVISLVYVAFCVLQFSYLFAGVGLPNNLTYSEYARAGFAQLICVAGINFLIFGLVTRYAAPARIMLYMRALFLIFNTVMLASSFLRLGLYIGVYGMTWLRLISVWFIIFLAASVILCAVRLFKENLPALMICALALIGWFCVLGYVRPESLIEYYNLNNLIY